MKVKRKYLNDLLIYFQKTYHLYFVEFRKAPNGKSVIVLCNPKNKDWWICLILNKFYITVLPACTGNSRACKERIMLDIFRKEYKGYGNKYEGKWLKL